MNHRPSSKMRGQLATWLALGSAVLLSAGLTVLPSLEAAAADTITITSVSPTSPQAHGASVTITANVGSGQTSNVEFNYSLDGSTYNPISNCTSQTLSGSTATCVTTLLPAGTEYVQAAYPSTSPDATNDYAFSVTGNTSSSISLSTASNTQVVGTSVAINATVTATAIGTVAFDYSTNGTSYTPIPSCTSVSFLTSPVTCNTATTDLPLGTVDLRATYSGDSTFVTSTSAALPYTVTPGPGSSTFTITSVTPSSPVVFQTPVTITATASAGPSGGTVNFKSSSDGVTFTSISGCSSVNLSSSSAQCAATTAIPIGTKYLDAVYSGDHSYASVTTAAVPFVVNPGSASSYVAVAAVSPVSPQIAGTSVTITAVLGSLQTGTVAFQYSLNGSTFAAISTCAAQPISGSTSTCTTSTLPVGTVDVDAVYSGDHTYASATSATYPDLVRTTSTTTLVATPVSPQAYGTTLTLAATVTTGATGTVTFQTSANDITFTPVAGCSAQALSLVTHVASCLTAALPTGLDYLDAVYSGDSTYITSTSAPITFVVNKANQSALTLTSTSGVLGKALTFLTSGGSGTGLVTFTVANGTATGCSISGVTLKASTAGTCLVTVTKAADANYFVASSVATTVTFVKPTPKATRVIGTPIAGKTTEISIAGSYFYGSPTIQSNLAHLVTRVTKDTGSLLGVRVTVPRGAKPGVYVFALRFKNGERTNVKFHLQ